MKPEPTRGEETPGERTLGQITPRDRPVMRSDGTRIVGLVVPVTLAISFIAHLAFLTSAIILGDANPFNTSPAEAITVEIVTPEEVPKPSEKPSNEPPPADKAAEDAKPSPPAAPAKPTEIKPIETAAAPPASRPVREAWPPLPAPAQADAPSGPGAADLFGLPLTLPGGMIGEEYQMPATEKADIGEDAKATFLRHLKSCLALPAGVTARMSVGAKVTLEIRLNPDGTLMNGPENPHAVGGIYHMTTGGGDIYNAAKEAVFKCQPYTVLPADRYDEWRTLNLTFTPENFLGK